MMHGTMHSSVRLGELRRLTLGWRLRRQARVGRRTLSHGIALDPSSTAEQHDVSRSKRHLPTAAPSAQRLGWKGPRPSPQSSWTVLDVICRSKPDRSFSATVASAGLTPAWSAYEGGERGHGGGGAAAVDAVQLVLP